MLLFVQFGLGGLGNLFIPRLVPVFGTNVLFFSLIAFSVVTLLMVPFLDRYEVTKAQQKVHDTPKAALPLVPIALVLASLFLFQASNNGLFAFIIGLGIRVVGRWLRSPAEGADTVVWAATDADIIKDAGSYFADREVARSTRHARDDDQARRLWDASEKILADVDRGASK